MKNFPSAHQHIINRAVDENRTHALGFKNYHFQKNVFNLKLKSDRLKLKDFSNANARRGIYEKPIVKQ